MISFVEMDNLHFESFKDRSLKEYACKMVANGLCNEADAYSSSQKSFDMLLPNGKITQNHSLRLIVLEDGRRAGDVWTMIFENKLILLDIFIEPEFRRQGIAKKVIGSFEDECNRNGLVEIQLHVFGDNVNAISLYSKLGFQSMSIKMRKILQPA